MNNSCKHSKLYVTPNIDILSSRYHIVGRITILNYKNVYNYVLLWILAATNKVLSSYNKCLLKLSGGKLQLALVYMCTKCSLWERLGARASRASPAGWILARTEVSSLGARTRIFAAEPWRHTKTALIGVLFTTLSSQEGTRRPALHHAPSLLTSHVYWWLTVLSFFPTHLTFACSLLASALICPPRLHDVRAIVRPLHLHGIPYAPLCQTDGVTAYTSSCDCSASSSAQRPVCLLAQLVRSSMVSSLSSCSLRYVTFASSCVFSCHAGLSLFLTFPFVAFIGFFLLEDPEQDGGEAWWQGKWQARGT